MTDDDALYALDLRLRPTVLTDLQELVFRYSWAGKSYTEMAELSGYDADYLKDVGARLWKLLSQTLGLRVAKSNLQSVFHSALNPMLDGVERPISLDPQVEPGMASGSQSTRLLSSSIDMQVTDYPAPTVATTTAMTAMVQRVDPAPPTRVDWGEAMEVYRFYGREAELQTLSQWIGVQRCRLVAVLGMGGMGKSALAIRFVETAIATGQFQQVIWRSLRNAPPLSTLLVDLIQVLSQQQETQTSLPSEPLALMQCLLSYLRQSRCLLVLDNVETVLRPDEADYDMALRQLGETRHQSSVLLTSREKPAAVALQEGNQTLVRSLVLPGVDLAAGQAIFQQRGKFVASSSDWELVMQKYVGNPLALKIVACAVEELFNHSVSSFVEFLQTQTLIFDDIRDLLARQFEHLTDLEQEVMLWLAINREFVSFSELQADLLPPQSQRRLPETLKSLVRKSLIETKAGQFTQQPVVMEYITEKLIERFSIELRSGTAEWNHHAITDCFLHRYALIKATSKDYLKQSQRRLLLQPIIAALKAAFPLLQLLEQQLKSLVQEVRSRLPNTLSYSSGNLINLLCALNSDLSDADFSQLCLWQADLQGIPLHRVNFQGADLSRSVFSETLGAVFSVAFLPNGSQLMSGDTQGNVCLWNLETGQRLRVYGCFPGWVTGLAVSQDGQWVAAGAGDLIKLWQVETGECLHTLKGHHGTWITSLIFTPDGRSLLSSGGEDCSLCLWDVASGSGREILRTSSMIWNADLHPHTDQIAIAQGDHQITLWQAAHLVNQGTHNANPVSSGSDLNLESTYHLIRTFTGHENEVESVRFSPDGQTMVSGSSDALVKLWHVATGECLRTFIGHQDQVWDAIFSPDGRIIASSSMDRTVKLWDVETGQCLRTLEGYDDHVYGIEFSRDGHLLLTGSMDYTVRVWETATGACRKLWQGSKNVSWGVRFVPTAAGEQVAAAWRDGLIRLWDSRGDCVQRLTGHQAWARAVTPIPHVERVLPGIRWAIASGADDAIKLWNLADGSCLQQYKGHQRPVTSLAATMDGRRLLSASMDRTLKLWDTRTAECLHTFRDHQHWVFAVTISPIAAIAASASLDGTAKLWDLNQRCCLHTYTGHKTRLFSVAFSADGQRLFTGSADHLIKVWDVATGTCLHTLEGHSGWVFALATSPDSRWLASGSADTTVRLWDVRSLTCSQVLTSHNQSVFSVAFNADGSQLVSSGYDETLYLWDLATATCRHRLAPEKLYAGMNITQATGLTDAQKLTLQELGAIDTNSHNPANSGSAPQLP